MTEQDVPEINWTAAFIGFGVDWAFSELVGLLAMSIMLLLKGVSLNGEDALPPDVILVRQIVGVLGATIGGVVAGYIARRRGTLHGVLGSAIGLIAFLCSVPILGAPALEIGDLGFIVLNLIGAGRGGGFGERWRDRREGDRQSD